MEEDLQMLGNAALMERPKVAFLSSRKVAPAAVMRCYDWATGMRGGGGTPGGSAGRLAPPCVVGGFQSALEKDVLLEPGQIGVRALRTELECAWVMARARASAASFWGSSSSARSVLTMR